ncbi:MAG: hypothetical protein WD689_04850 [Gaiellaceae bacterium]
MNRYEEETLAELLRLLPPAPEAWVKAAQELPPARGRLDELVARAEADAKYREELMANLERALEEAGLEPNPAVVDAVRDRLSKE